MFKTNANGTEQGQTLAVIPLFDHAHAFAGYNGTPIVGTYKDAEFNPKEFTVTIHFKENSVEESLAMQHKANVWKSTRSMEKQPTCSTHPPLAEWLHPPIPHSGQRVISAGS